MRIVLTADETLTSTYRNVSLLDFLGCAPVEKLPKIAYRILDSQIGHENGRLKFAPYGLRKVEAALLSQGYNKDEVVVAHPKHVEKFIDEKTTIVGVNTMDPMGLGPVSMIFTEGEKNTSYSAYKFACLLGRINGFRKRRRYQFKIVVGGQGGWQLEIKKERAKQLGVDHIIKGETEHIIGELFRDVESGSSDEVIEVKTWPKVEEIPTIVNPTYKGMVEVTRGCGRGCRFCAPNLRFGRHFPMEKIEEEIDLNLKHGMNNAWLHSEDIFMYQNEDRKNFYPNEDAIFELFKMAFSKVDHVNPTHSTVAGALAAPNLLRKIHEMDVSRSGKNKKHLIGVQVGFETASSRLIKKYSNNKMKPFSAEEWPWVMLNGTYVFNKNYWFPAYTTIIGLPDETEEDEIETARLIITMEKELKKKLGKRAHFTVTPLAFVPMGVLKDESFFDVTKDMNKGRILHLYHAWRHLMIEVDEALSSVMAENLFYPIFKPMAEVGSRLVLSKIKQWALKNGVDVDKKLEPLDVKIENR